ncbi:MAG: hypothetical protein H7Z75_09675 [Ferruginibacter sp.]|nr:hypothetical protein [Cytophagales bacterium]
MSSIFRDPAEPNEGSFHPQETGTLRVELPHWAAQVRIYDNRYQPVAGVGASRHRNPSGVYETATTLPPGIYEVETTLEGKTERELTAVRSRETTLIGQARWRKLTLVSAAPLAGTADAQAEHTTPAEEWSRQTTWKASPGGDSRLFLFVRTTEPARYRSFANGLSLLDAAGRLLTDFSGGIEKDAKKGWMAFNADLPAGFYILRRGTRGARVRFQPVYLCAGWETQVFLAARDKPSLRTLTLNMARRNAGFDSGNETVLAAEVVLDSLRRSGSSLEIVTSEQMATLLNKKPENPWLGMLAAWVLLAAQEETSVERATDSGQKVPVLLREVRKFLTLESNHLGDHPDVRALSLREEEAAPQPFWYPPLLRVGLKRVHRHATRFAETIPVDSLTDCVLDSLLANSPWTAWRSLDRPPQLEQNDPVSSRGRHLFTPHKAPLPPASAYPTQPADFLPGTSPKAPLFRLTPGPEAGASAQDFQSDAPAAPNPAALHDVPLLQLAQTLTQSGNLHSLPEEVILPAQSVTKQLLGVEPKAISAASGLPLARTERGLERLRRSWEQTSELSVGGVSTEAVFTPSERIILEYALQNSGKPDRDRPPPVDRSPENDPATPFETAGYPSLTIEDCVTRLYAESNRLKAEARDVYQVKQLQNRLQKVADNLLESADFIVITDPQGRIQYGNGAFILLLSPSGNESIPAQEAVNAKAHADRIIQENLWHWEGIFAPATVGHRTISRTTARLASPDWDLWRTAFKPESGAVATAYFNVLRRKDAPLLAPGILNEIEPLLPNLTLFTSFFAHAPAQSRGEYAQQLESLAQQLEEIFRRYLAEATADGEARNN